MQCQFSVSFNGTLCKQAVLSFCCSRNHEWYEHYESYNGVGINSPVILWFNLELIATQAFLTVSGTEKCAL